MPPKKKRTKSAKKGGQREDQKETLDDGKTSNVQNDSEDTKSYDGKKEDVSHNQVIKGDGEKKAGTESKKQDNVTEQKEDIQMSIPVVDGTTDTDKQVTSPRGEEKKKKNRKGKKEWTFESYLHRESANIHPILLDFIEEMGKDVEGCITFKRLHETGQYMSLLNYCSEKPKVEENVPEKPKSGKGGRSRGKDDALKKLEEENAELNKQIDQARRKIAEEMGTNRKLIGRMSQLEEENNTYKRNSGIEEKLHENMKEKEKIISDLESKVSTQESELAQQSEEAKNFSTMYTTLKEQNESMSRDLEAVTQSHRELDSKLQSETESKNMLQRRVDQLNKTNNKLKTELDDMKADRDTYKDRKFSQLAGAKLTTGNADIADLSDENRPQKIAEKFSELYDNQWTDAYEELTEECKLSEPDTIKQLLETLRICESICSETAERQQMALLRNIKEDLTMTQDDIPSETMCNGGENEDDSMNNDIDVSLSTQDRKFLLEMRKTNASWTLPVLQKKIKKEVEKNGECVKGQNFRIYLEKCVEICWYSCIQDPPLQYDFEPCVEVDDALVKTYTKKGHTVDFVVWPLLRIQYGGAILAKGIVQPVAETKSKKNTA